MKPMRILAALTLLFALVLPAVPLGAETGEGEPGSAKVRQSEHLRQRAAELRERADHLRNDAGGKGASGASAKAKALDQQADALMRRADGVEPQNWPPK
jgi:hypothetical protein